MTIGNEILTITVGSRKGKANTRQYVPSLLALLAMKRVAWERHKSLMKRYSPDHYDEKREMIIFSDWWEQL